MSRLPFCEVCLVVCGTLVFGGMPPALGQYCEGWVDLHRSPEEREAAGRDLAVDARGFVYVMGMSDEKTGQDFLILKYDPMGNLLWKRVFDGPVHGRDLATAIAFDGAHVYVTGFSEGEDGSRDYLTVKLTTNGELEWSRRFAGPVEAVDTPSGIALGPEGSVYVTGESDTTMTGEDYLTIKYDAEGNELWVQRFGAVGNDQESPVAIVVDSQGNSYVTGEGEDSYLTLKYDVGGKLLWERRYQPPGRRGQATVLELVHSDLLVVGGWMQDEFATIAYDADGELLWEARDATGERLNAITSDDHGNVHITGRTAQESGRDFYTISYDRNGVERWAARYDSGDQRLDWPADITVGHTGNVFVHGLSLRDERPAELVLLAYDVDGELVGRETFPGLPDGQNPFPGGIAVAPNGTVNVTARTNGPLGNSATTIRYAFETVRSSTSFHVSAGEQVYGGVMSLSTSDDDRLILRAVRPSRIARPSAELIVESVAPPRAFAHSFTLQLETSAMVRGVRQTVDLYDFAAESWTRFDARPMETNDAETVVFIADEPERFISTENLVRARIGCHNDGINFAGWTVRIDHVGWTLCTE